ncbi:hypothetical protein ACFW04_000788 [Cataglyphis niger]
MTSCKIWNKQMAHEFSLYRRVMWPLGRWIVTKILQNFYYDVLYLHKYQLQQSILSIIVDQFVLASCNILSIMKITNLCNAANNWACNIVRQDYRQVMLCTNLGRFVFFFQMGSEYVVIVSLAAGPLLSFATLSSLENITRSEIQMQLPHEMICPSNVPVVCYGIYILHTILILELLQFHKGEENHYWNKIKIIALVERHCLLLDLAEDIVDTFDIILIAQLILHVLLICLLGLQFIVSLALHDFAVVGTSIMSFNVLMILFLYSYMEETLLSKTQAISQVIYLSDWYDLPTNIMQDLCFIIAHLNSFKNVLKASVSYFSVLQIMFTQ